MVDANGEGFRVTVGVLYTQIEGLKAEVVALRTEQALLNQSVQTMVAVIATQGNRVERLEGRFNGMIVGIGSGVAVALVALFRGLVS